MIKALGRPPKFATPEDMQEAVIDYFDNYAVAYDEEGEMSFKPTITGLAYHLGMTTAALRGYEEKDDFLSIVKRAKQLVEMSLENRLDSKMVTGAIFNLKANFRWNDGKQEEVSSGDVMADAISKLIDKLPN